MVAFHTTCTSAGIDFEQQLDISILAFVCDLNSACGQSLVMATTACPFAGGHPQAQAIHRIYASCNLPEPPVPSPEPSPEPTPSPEPIWSPEPSPECTDETSPFAYLAPASAVAQTLFSTLMGAGFALPPIATGSCDEGLAFLYAFDGAARQINNLSDSNVASYCRHFVADCHRLPAARCGAAWTVSSYGSHVRCVMPPDGGACDRDPTYAVISPAEQCTPPMEQATRIFCEASISDVNAAPLALLLGPSAVMPVPAGFSSASHLREVCGLTCESYGFPCELLEPSPSPGARPIGPFAPGECCFDNCYVSDTNCPYGSTWVGIYVEPIAVWRVNFPSGPGNSALFVNDAERGWTDSLEPGVTQLIIAERLFLVLDVTGSSMDDGRIVVNLGPDAAGQPLGVVPLDAEVLRIDNPNGCLSPPGTPSTDTGYGYRCALPPELSPEPDPIMPAPCALRDALDAPFAFLAAVDINSLLLPCNAQLQYNFTSCPQPTTGSCAEGIRFYEAFWSAASAGDANLGQVPPMCTAPIDVLNSHTAPYIGGLEVSLANTSFSSHSAIRDICALTCATIYGIGQECGEPPSTMWFEVSDRTNSGEEDVASGSMYLTSSDLELMRDGSSQQTVGIVFPHVAIVPSDVDDAQIAFEVDEVHTQSSEPLSIRIVGELSANAALPSQQAFDLSSRMRTSAMVMWSPDVTPTVGERIYTPDISSIVREITDQPGWTAGNRLCILFELVSGTGIRWVKSHSAGAGGGVTPALQVDRTPDPQPAPIDCGHFPPECEECAAFAYCITSPDANCRRAPAHCGPVCTPYAVCVPQRPHYWGASFNNFDVGTLVAHGPEHLAFATRALSERNISFAIDVGSVHFGGLHFGPGANASHPQPDEGDMVWVHDFHMVDLSPVISANPMCVGAGVSGPAAGLDCWGSEMRLLPDGRIAFVNVGTIHNINDGGDGSSGFLHLNCADLAVGSQVKGLATTGDWADKWVVNDDATISPFRGGMAYTDFVLAWGSFRTSSCYTANHAMRPTLERRDNSSALKFHFVRAPPRPPMPPAPPPPPPPHYWGARFANGDTGTLVATGRRPNDPSQLYRFSVSIGALNYIEGATAANPTPASGQNVWVNQWQHVVDLSEGAQSGTELRLLPSGHVTFAHVHNEGRSNGLHINCGDWTPLVGAGSQLIGLGSVHEWSEHENRWVINDDATVSPWYQGMAHPEFVLGWGQYRTGSCHTPNFEMRVTIERRDDASATLFYFTRVGESLPAPPPPSPPLVWVTTATHVAAVDPSWGWGGSCAGPASYSGGLMFFGFPPNLASTLGVPPEYDYYIGDSIINQRNGECAVLELPANDPYAAAQPTAMDCTARLSWLIALYREDDQARFDLQAGDLVAFHSGGCASSTPPVVRSLQAKPATEPLARPDAAPLEDVLAGELATPCSDYDDAVYDDDDEARGLGCPPEGSTICGSNVSVATTLTADEAVRRPYRIGHQRCAHGCVCESAVRTTRRSCEGDFVYVGTCDAVYSVDSAAAAQALRGKRLEWDERTFGEQVLDGSATVHSGRTIDHRFVESAASTWASSGVTFRTRGALEQYVGDDSTFATSMPGGATFRFGGAAFSVLYVSSNGYLCFDEAALTSPKTSGLLPEHFAPSGGRCFSFLFADLAPESVHVCHVERQGAGGEDGREWEPHATYVTLEDVPLRGDDATGGGNTVQVELNYWANSIAVTYGSVAWAITAVLGPSLGQGLADDFVAKHLA